MEENLSMYWMVENSVEVVNSLFYVLVLDSCLLSLLTTESTWISSLQLQGFVVELGVCLFYVLVLGPALGALLIRGQTRGEDEAASGPRDQNAVDVLGGEDAEMTD